MDRARAFDVPHDRHYDRAHHLWARRDDDTGRVRIGVDAIGLESLGELAYVELQAEGKVVTRGEPVGSLEAAKMTTTIASPVSGTIVARNRAVLADPLAVNRDPYGAGWLVEVEPSGWQRDAAELLGGDAIGPWADAEIARLRAEDGATVALMAWRLLEEDGASAAAGLATDELLARRVGAGASPATLRLYTYRPHCALVGRFQNVAHEVHVPYCSRHGIELNRRPTGGGAILMGPDQLGVALLLRGRGDGMHGHARALMERFSRGIARGLSHLGITAGFRGKNDLEVGGRKIAGLGIHRDPSGGLLFHASVLVDLDVALMARVLRLSSTDDAELDAAELTTLKSRTTTVRECLARAVGMAEVRGRIAAGFADAFEVSLDAGELDAEEHAAVAALEREKYATAAWLWQETAVSDVSGVAALRTPGGTVEARVALAGHMLKAVHLRGDFFESSGAIADLEARLRWRPAETIAATVAGWAAGHPVETVPPEAFARAIEAAVEQALREAPQPGRPEADVAPYGCFVSPGAGHD